MPQAAMEICAAIQERRQVWDLAQARRMHGAEETARAPRMALGDDAAWRPEAIFARAAGYCG